MASGSSRRPIGGGARSFAQEDWAGAADLVDGGLGLGVPGEVRVGLELADELLDDRAGAAEAEAGEDSASGDVRM